MRAALLLVVLLVAAGCVGPNDEPVPTPTPITSPTDEPPTPFEPQFDGDRALGLVREQVRAPDGSTRYRVPGTAGNTEVAAWIAGELEARGFSASWHHFNATYGCETVAMRNIVGERAGTSGRMVILGAHYDTRPIADKDPDPARRDEPIAGANDGGSGVAVLLELTRVMPPTNDTVRLLFFDGEDGGGYKDTNIARCTDWILGSRAYAAAMSQDEVNATSAFVLVDMVGDTNLVLPRERNSDPTLQARIYDIGRELGHEQFLATQGISVLDDHVPFIERGIAAVDLIHTIPGDPRAFPPSHHTHDDDMENVSAASLLAVGQTLEAWLASLG